MRRNWLTAALMDAPGELNALDAAAQEITGWAAQGWVIVTVLDPDYPTWLRGIHQAPRARGPRHLCDLHHSSERLPALHPL